MLYIKSPVSLSDDGSDDTTLYLSAKSLIPDILLATVVTLVFIASRAFKSDTKSDVANVFKSDTKSDVANKFKSLTIS